ncbi:Large terminase protein-like protein UL15b [Bienertia sinuspersici]
MDELGSQKRDEGVKEISCASGSHELEEGVLGNQDIENDEEAKEEVVWEDEGSKEDEARMELAMVGKIWTERHINTNAFIGTMKRVWQAKSGMEVREIEKNTFVIQFYHWMDKSKVVNGQPWHFDRHSIILADIIGNMKPSDVQCYRFPMWVRVYNLPFKERSNEANIKNMAKKLGELKSCKLRRDRKLRFRRRKKRGRLRGSEWRGESWKEREGIAEGRESSQLNKGEKEGRNKGGERKWVRQEREAADSGRGPVVVVGSKRIDRGVSEGGEDWMEVDEERVVKKMATESRLQGDFNLMLSSEEKYGGDDFSAIEADIFCDALRECNLNDLGFIGHEYTWNNNRGGVNNIQERLDRFVATESWKSIYPCAYVSHLEQLRSDHLPILLNCKGRPDAGNERRRRKLYRF